MLTGKLQLDLLRNNVVVHREEKKNTITPWYADAIKKGNMHLNMSPEKMLPLKQWFNGCLLTDKANDPSISMIAGDANVIAQASNNAYSGPNLRRGSFNTNESGNVTGGYRYVFEWNTSQGCGEILSCCLTRPALAATDFRADFSAPDAVCLEYLSPRTIRSSMIPGYISIVDYAKERAYSVYYESETIKIKEYYINTWRYHLTGAFCDAISLITTHEIPQAIANWSANYTSVSYTGDYFYIFKTTDNSGLLDEYKISSSTWTCVKTSHTYSGVHLRSHYSSSAYLQKDIILVVGNYAWAYGYNNSKIYKLNLTNDADIEEFNNPIASVSTDYRYNGPGLILPNGDWYKFSVHYAEDTAAVYHHNDTFYRVAGGVISGNDWGEGVPSIHGNGFGTALTTAPSDDATNGQNWLLSALFPYVSTVCNLDNAVTKTNDLTMKLTYTIAES